MEGVDTGKPIIVLDHQPWSFAEMNMNGVDLGLHGHTHNGQLWPYPLLMKLVYECPYGYYKKGTYAILCIFRHWYSRTSLSGGNRLGIGRIAYPLQSPQTDWRKREKHDAHSRRL